MLYLLVFVFAILSFLCLKAAFKQPKPEQRLSFQELPLTGKGSKTHLLYLGIAFGIIAVITFLKLK